MPLLPLLLAACAHPTVAVDRAAPAAAEPGRIRGRVCDPSGRTWLAGAMVYANVADDAGHVVDVRTAWSNVEGDWTLDELPAARTYTVYVTWGAELLSQESVYVGPRADVALDEPACFDPRALDVAVVSGAYDDFEAVLGPLGFANVERVDGQDAQALTDFLGGADALAAFDLLFLNGGLAEEGVIYDGDRADQAMANLRGYVEGGGTLYASDQAYDVVEIGWPDVMDFVGDDAERGDAEKGDRASVEAAVSDEALAEVIGTSYVPITYDLPVWPPIVSVANGVSVHLTASVPYSEGVARYELAQVPILVSFNSGQGKVVFSTFRAARNASEEVLDTWAYIMHRL